MHVPARKLPSRLEWLIPSSPRVKYENVLEAAHQNRAGLGDGLKVLSRLSDEILVLAAYPIRGQTRLQHITACMPVCITFRAVSCLARTARAVSLSWWSFLAI